MTSLALPREDSTSAPAGLSPTSVSAAAWMAALPSAGIVAVGTLLLGPLLGDAVFSLRPSYTFWPDQPVVPEPTEVGRYLVVCCAPLVLGLMTIAFVRVQSRLRPWLVSLIGGVAQLATVGVLIACAIGQHRPEFVRVYFTPRTLVIAGAIALILLAAARHRWTHARLTRWTRESRTRRVAALALAVVTTAVSMLPAINTDRSLTWNIDAYHVAFPLDEAFAVVNGLTPLVDFSAQYGSLWPFASALSLIVFGKTLLVFTITMATITALGMLSIYGVLRRAARNSIMGLLLFLPFIATSFVIVHGTYVNRFSFGTYFAMFPLRYGGPFILAWLTARWIERLHPRSAWPLFTVSGLVMLNNTDFGAAAFAATFVAIILARRVAMRRLAVDVLLGLASAMALVSVLTLVMAGSLPNLTRLTEFGRIYGLGGFNTIPLPALLGLPLIIYLTHVAAIGTATVRAVQQQSNRVLTSMLAWAGVFGLGAGDYYVLRSHPDTLQSTFSAWALSLALLAIVAVHGARSVSWRRPPIVTLAVLFGLGLAICSVAQTPMPWREVQRIQSSTSDPNAPAPSQPLTAPTDEATREFVSSLARGRDSFVTKAGAPVAIFATTGHRIADAYGVRNIVPYTGAESIQTAEQFEASLDALAQAGGNTVLMPIGARGDFVSRLQRRGFEIATQSGLKAIKGNVGETVPGAVLEASQLQKWVDARRLHPRALR